MQDMDVKQLLARVHEIRNLDQLGENASTVLHFHKNDKTGKESIPLLPLLHVTASEEILSYIY